MAILKVPFLNKNIRPVFIPSFSVRISRAVLGSLNCYENVKIISCGMELSVCDLQKSKIRGIMLIMI